MIIKKLGKIKKSFFDSIFGEDCQIKISTPKYKNGYYCFKCHTSSYTMSEHSDEYVLFKCKDLDEIIEDLGKYLKGKNPYIIYLGSKQYVHYGLLHFRDCKGKLLNDLKEGKIKITKEPAEDKSNFEIYMSWC